MNVRAELPGEAGGGLLRSLTVTVSRYWLAALMVLIFFGGWELLIRLLNVPSYLLPSVSAILSALWTQRSDLLTQTGITLQVIVLGLLLGVAVGMALAIVMAYSRTLERALYPILIMFQAVPVPAIASPLVILLGYNILPKLTVVVLIVFFPVAVNEFIGLTGVDTELLNLMRSMSASAWQIFWNVRFPASLPFLFAGLKLAAIYSVIAAVFGEWVGSDGGLGWYLQVQNSQLRTDRVFADIFILSALGILLFWITGLLERISTPWRHRAVK